MGSEVTPGLRQVERFQTDLIRGEEEDAGLSAFLMQARRVRLKLPWDGQI